MSSAGGGLRDRSSPGRQAFEIRRVPAALTQGELFEGASELPEGMRYVRELLCADEEQALIEELRALPFKEFEFHGFLGRRRVLSFGWRYDFNGGGLQETAALPVFLLPVRERAARFAGLEPASLEHALLIEYAPGAGIGWHRDRPDFEDVIGISLRSPCTFRLRRRTGARWERLSISAEPRSAYLLRGPSRSEWAHSIPPLQTLRYSITFRSLAPCARRRGPRAPAAAPVER